MYAEGGGSKKKFLQKGEVLFREGDKGDAAFLVNSGLIGIYKVVEGQEVELATLKPGELFGEMAIVDGSNRMANAVAREDSVVVAVPASTLESRLQKVDPFLRALMKILVANLRSVHDSYMRRARSVTDYINAMQFHAQGFRLYLTKLGGDPLAQPGLDKLEQIERLLDELRADFKQHADSRQAALREEDVTRKRPE